MKEIGSGDIDISRATNQLHEANNQKLLYQLFQNGKTSLREENHPKFLFLFDAKEKKRFDKNKIGTN